MFLLDTNVISETRRPSRHGALIQWLAAQPPEKIFIPSIAFLEMQRGVELLKKQDSRRALEIEQWVDELSGSANILNFDVADAREYSRLVRRKPNFVSEDAMIAAMARTRGFTVVTRNIRDFEDFDVPLFNPVKEASPRPS
jgi:predicted nucleic acid-binding protein